MKKSLYISTLVLSTLLGSAIVNADETVATGEASLADEVAEGKSIDLKGAVKKTVKGTIGGVKKVVGGVKKAIPITAAKDEVLGDGESDTAKNATDTAATTTMTTTTAKSETEGDTKDAEANRKVSDTSIAIYSQNPYIQDVMEDTTHIKAFRLKELLARGDKVTMLDIRPRSEFAKTPGIKGVTLNIPRNFLEVEAYEKLPNKDASIIIISSKGIRGGIAANTLQYMGYTNVRNLMDGLEGWNKAK